MANPQPCQRCNESPDAEFMVTDRTPDFQILGAVTQSVCVQCFIELGMTMAQALQQAYAEQQQLQESLDASRALEESGMPQEAPQSVGTEPGLLEQVEADEGGSTRPISSAKPKRRRQTDSEEIHQDVPEETEATHVHS